MVDRKSSRIYFRLENKSSTRWSRIETTSSTKCVHKNKVNLGGTQWRKDERKTTHYYAHPVGGWIPDRKGSKWPISGPKMTLSRLGDPAKRGPGLRGRICTQKQGSRRIEMCDENVCANRVTTMWWQKCVWQFVSVRKSDTKCFHEWRKCDHRISKMRWQICVWKIVVTWILTTRWKVWRCRKVPKPRKSVTLPP